MDRMTSLLLDFAPGHSAGICSTQMVFYQRMQIFGTDGRIEIEIPFNAPPDRPCRVLVDTGTDLFGTGIDGLEWTFAISTRSRATSSPRPFSMTPMFRRRSKMP